MRHRFGVPGSRSRARTADKPARTRAPDDKRARILTAARELFAEQGFQKTSTAAIAREAGVSEGIVFHHFGSKRGVLSEVSAEYGRGAALAMFEGVLPGERPEPREMLRGVFEYARANGTLHRCLKMVGDPDDFNAATARARDVIIGALTAAFETWRSKGYITTERPKIAASLLFGLVEYAVFECFVRGDGEDWEVYWEEAATLIDRALCTVHEDEDT